MVLELKPKNLFIPVWMEGRSTASPKGLFGGQGSTVGEPKLRKSFFFQFSEQWACSKAWVRSMGVSSHNRILGVSYPQRWMQVLVYGESRIASSPPFHHEPLLFVVSSASLGYSGHLLFGDKGPIRRVVASILASEWGKLLLVFLCFVRFDMEKAHRLTRGPLFRYGV